MQENKRREGSPSLCSEIANVMFDSCIVDAEPRPRENSMKKGAKQGKDEGKKIFRHAKAISCQRAIFDGFRARYNTSMIRTATIALVVGLVASGASILPACAHPLSTDTAHDRVITVKLQKTDIPNRMRARIEYRLEAGEETILRKDMAPYRDEIDFLDYFPDRPLEYYALFAKKYEAIFADRLLVSVNKKPLDLRCVQRTPRLTDEDGKKLGHLRCDFAFETAFEIDPERKTQFEFEDKTYYLEEGRIALSLVNESGLAIESLTIPSEEQQKKSAALDDDRLRQLKAVLAPRSTPPAKGVEPPAPATPPREAHGDSFALLPLLLHGEYGLALTLLLAFLFGAAHALTPGHGKTLVAAYLVGERGTVWHAGYLGLVTTLTHTGSVLVLAAIVALLPAEQQDAVTAWIINGLGLVMGLIVVGIGFWLLLQRLAGRADHVHLGGGHHHHHHGDAPRTLSWGGLTLLGITGGMVPCMDAIILFVYTVGTSKFWLVLPAVLAFSAGLAIVLVAIGVLVVQVPRFAEARFGNGRLLRALPIVSAAVVTLMGLWLCYETVRGR